MEPGDLIAVADREFADCAHRLVEWLVPMPDRVVRELREQGWSQVGCSGVTAELVGEEWVLAAQAGGSLLASFLCEVALVRDLSLPASEAVAVRSRAARQGRAQRAAQRRP